MSALTQLPDVVDLSFVAGDTFRIQVKVTAPGTAEALPLADYDFCAQITQTQIPDRIIVGEFAVAEDPDDAANAVILTLDKHETDKLLVAGTGNEFHGFWDLEVTFPAKSGQTEDERDVRTVVKGSVTCVVDISRLTP